MWNFKQICCNPFNLHFKGVGSDLRHPSETLIARALEMKGRVVLSAEDLLCGHCRKVVYDQPKEDETTTTNSQPDNTPPSSQLSSASTESPSIAREKAKEFIETVSGSAINVKYFHFERKVSIAKRKLEEIDLIVKKKLCIALDLPVNSLDGVDDSESEDLMKLMNAIRDKLPTLMYRDRIQLLTVSPPSWSERQVSNFFNVSRYAAKKAKHLRETEGIFAKPPPNAGRPILDSTKQLVFDFYCSPDVSRVMPGRRDTVSMGGGVHEQKRLLLGNLKELYLIFKEQNPSVKLGFSLFAALRPKFCVMAGSAGTHNVCLCTTHQNLKLKFHALKIDLKVKELIPSVVCAQPTRECMLRICKNCPEEEEIISTLQSYVLRGWDDTPGPRMPEELESSLKDILQETVQYNEWTSVDRAEILTLQLTVKELLQTVARDLQKAIPHHFTAQEQGKFFKDTKENLQPDEALILMDFNMNYSCLLQDAIQNYHWSKKQATVHPVVIYYKENGILTHKSLCFLSDDLDHDSSLVQAIQDRTMQYLTENHPSIKKATYMTDGCGPQYKNFKSFIYMCK